MRSSWLTSLVVFSAIQLANAADGPPPGQMWSAVEARARDGAQVGWRFKPFDRVVAGGEFEVDGSLGFALKLAQQGDLAGAADAADRVLASRPEAWTMLRAIRLRATWIAVDKPSEAEVLFDLHELLIENTPEFAISSPRAWQHERLAGSVAKADLLEKQERRRGAIDVLRGLVADRESAPRVDVRAMLRLRIAGLLRGLGDAQEADRERDEATAELGATPEFLMVRARFLMSDCSTQARNADRPDGGFERCLRGSLADPLIASSGHCMKFWYVLVEHIRTDPRRTPEQRANDSFAETSAAIRVADEQAPSWLAAIDQQPGPEALKEMLRRDLEDYESSLHWNRLRSRQARADPHEGLRWAEEFLVRFPTQPISSSVERLRDDFVARIEKQAK